MDKNDVVHQAKAAYYSLERQGLKSFQCTVAPDWKDFFEQKIEGYSDATTMEMIKRVRLSVVRNESGQLDLTPFLEGGGKIDGNVAILVDGLVNTLFGFYQILESNVVLTPFSTFDKDFTLDEKGDEYRIVMIDQDGRSELSMTKDYVITEIQFTLNTPDISETVFWPVFEKTDKGLLLSRLSTLNNNGQSRATWDILYKEVAGLILPSNLVVKNSKGGTTVRLKVDFNQYKVSQ